MQNTSSNRPRGQTEPAEVKERLKTLEDQLLLRTTIGSEVNQEQRLAALESAVSALAERQSIKEPTDPKEVQHLRSELHREIDGVHRKISGIQSRTDINESNISEILQSRIWRALCFGGAIALYVHSLSRRVLSRIGAEPSSDIETWCEDPLAADRTSKSAVIQVQGWATAPSGIDHVNIHIDGRASLLAKGGRARHDIARERSAEKDSRRWGFELIIDPALLPPGEHKIRIEAVTSSGVVGRVEAGVVMERVYATDYDRWIAEFEDRDEVDLRAAMDRFLVRPLISILMPVYNTPCQLLKLAVESVRKQTYENWELCIADDFSGLPELDNLIEEFARIDSRIKTMRRQSGGGIAAASNSAFELARGEFVGLLDHDDELSPAALFHVVEAINKHPDVGLLYSDEDKIDTSGRRYDPFFKPDWSPDLLLSNNYICHFSVCRRDLVERAGRFRSEYDGSQDHDLFLRLSRLTGDVIHIPRVLYHWRAIPGSAAADPSYKPRAADAARRAIEDHLRCAQIAACVEPGRYPGHWRVRYEWPEKARVSIQIPSGGKLDVLEANLNQLAATTEYQNYEIVVIDNSQGAEIEQFVRQWDNHGRRACHVDCRGEAFNWSALNNQAARLSNSELLLFLNDDTEVITPDWLTSMVELGMRPEVGAVGAKLLYPDGRIQHAGVVMGLSKNCDHAFRGLAGGAQHYFNFPDVIRNVSAVTGACLLVRRDVFWQLGGFDEKSFAVAFNDIDFCLRVIRAGYRVLYTPHAILYHHEAFSKTSKDLVPHSGEVFAMQTKWKQVIDDDPYYNPNLTRGAEDYSLRKRS
jgi:O-antigen biosynthesis protein